METLYQKFETLLQSTTTDFKRYLYQQISWDNRLIGIIGARGVGKTTDRKSTRLNSSHL